MHTALYQGSWNELRNSHLLIFNKCYITLLTMILESRPYIFRLLDYGMTEQCAISVNKHSLYCTVLYLVWWRSFNVATLRRFYSCYNKCLKHFFGFPKHSSLTGALLQTGLLSSTTVLHNHTYCFKDTVLACNNALVMAVSPVCF